MILCWMCCCKWGEITSPVHHRTNMRTINPAWLQWWQPHHNLHEGAEINSSCLQRCSQILVCTLYQTCWRIANRFLNPFASLLSCSICLASQRRHDEWESKGSAGGGGARVRHCLLCRGRLQHHQHGRAGRRREGRGLFQTEGQVHEWAEQNPL